MWKIKPRLTTMQRQQTVIFDMHDYMHTLTLYYKYTLVWKFSTTMPKVELIKKRFIQQTQLSGGPTLLTKMLNMFSLTSKMRWITTQCGHRIEWPLRVNSWGFNFWIPSFTQEEETPIVPIWILLPSYPGIAKKSFPHSLIWIFRQGFMIGYNLYHKI